MEYFKLEPDYSYEDYKTTITPSAKDSKHFLLVTDDEDMFEIEHIGCAEEIISYKDAECYSNYICDVASFLDNSANPYEYFEGTPAGRYEIKMVLVKYPANSSHSAEYDTYLDFVDRN